MRAHSHSATTSGTFRSGSSPSPGSKPSTAFEAIYRLPARSAASCSSYAPSMIALMSRCAGVRVPGSSALAMAHVAAGRLDAFWMASLRPWDIAAGAMLVKEAGGRIGDLAGGSNYLRTSEVIAASPGIFEDLRSAVQLAAA